MGRLAATRTFPEIPRDCIGFDVITPQGRRVGVVEDVFRSGKRRIGTCLLLARRIPGVGLKHFILPLKRVVFDPVQDCFVWNDRAKASSAPK